MKTWWLNLYTIPHLKSFTTTMAMIIIFSCAVLKLFPAFSTFAWLTLFYPVYCVGLSTKDDLLSNLEFHKNNVSFKELKRAVYLDMTISTSWYIALLIVQFLALNAMAAKKEILKGEEDMLPPSILIYYFIAFSSLIFFLKISTGLTEAMKHSSHKRKKMTNQHKIKMLGFAACGALFFHLTSKLIGNYHWNSELVTLTFLIMIFTVISVTYLKVKFQTIRPLKKEIFGAAVNTAVFFSVPFICVFSLARFEMTSNYLSLNERMETFSLFSDFSPTLSPKEAELYLLKRPDLAKHVFQKAAPESFDVPFEKLYSGKNLYVWRAYMERTTPSAQDVAYMVKRLREEKDSEDWKDTHSYTWVRNKIVSYSQDTDKVLPLALKQNNVVRNLASEPRRQKK